MHRPIFGHSFAVLVAPILLSVLAFNFLNKKKTSVRKNEEDADTGGSGSSVSAPIRTNPGGSSSSPTGTTNGSSSSSTEATGNSYDIFLSFRGQDTRNSFAGHLYNRLMFAKIHPFRDDTELPHGEKIGPHLLAAIKNSKILIPILSENYGASSWCLDELAQIMECKKNNLETIVLPIFYKVAPADVRHQSGKFGKAFGDRKKRLHARGFDPMIVKKWEDALKEVGDLRGREVNGSEAALIDSVVEQVLLELKKKFELVIPQNLVGIDNHVKKLMEVVNNNSSATLFFVIHGMGGIGKTTLAKKIYNELSNRFKYCCFIPDVRESCKRYGIEHLQSKLISVTLERDYKVSTRDEGIRFLSSSNNGKKVLIFLDDVDEDHDLKALAGNQSWFSSGSIVIITSRNMSIIDKARGDYPYELEGMGRNDSTILFSRHAFLRDSPPNEFKELTEKVVSTTGGLPLALEVLGSFLCGAERKIWIRTINKLKKIPDEEVQDKLRISYDALSPGQQQIFLDIACFFIGIDERIACYMWDACNFFAVGMEVLRLRSLIKVGNDHKFIMHDQLRDLGRWIVREGNENTSQHCSRLWDSEEALEVLKEKKGTNKIEAISLGQDSSKYRGVSIHQGDIILTGEQFEKLTNLRFLDATGALFSGGFKNPNMKLKWLRWQNCSLTFEANNFNARELAILELPMSNLSDGWEGWTSIKEAKNLKCLDLTNCQSLRTTSFLSDFENLEVLILKDCDGVEQIDPSIGNMKNLLYLDLSGCENLKGLPVEVGKLEALEQLHLESSGIEELPGSIGDLQSLKTLVISGSEIKDLPDSIHNLSSLQHLYLFDCLNLQSLPVLPSSLTYLWVTWLIHRLPSLSNLTHLKELYLHCECQKRCRDMLEILGLEELRYLESLEIVNCASIQRLDLPYSKSLKILRAQKCENLIEIQGLDRLESVEKIEIFRCASIERLNLPKSEGLKIFEATWCESLIEIQGLDRLESLEKIEICGSNLIERLNLPKSEGLKIFKATRCKSLIAIHGLDRLESVEKIEISLCDSIERLNLPKSEVLKIFDARWCNNLIEIQGLDGLESLEMIDISSCDSIQSLNLPKSKVLKAVKATWCKNLVEIRGLDKLESLKIVDVFGCIRFKGPKGISNLHNVID